MTTLPPAEWHPDPMGRFDHRYWDGIAWTEHVSKGGQQFVDPIPRVEQGASTSESTGRAGGYVVVDVETTGLSASQHRVVELAIVRTDSAGFPVSEWVQRFHPDGPVGATHIHGITDGTALAAPHPRAAVGDRRRGAVMVFPS